MTKTRELDGKQTCTESGSGISREFFVYVRRETSKLISIVDCYLFVRCCLY